MKVSIPSVLVVDDETAARQQLRDLLSPEGFQVHLARSGSEAIRKARSVDPTVVLLDLFLGGSKNGLDVAEEVRRLQPDTRFVVLSAFSDELSVRRLAEERALRVDAWIAKPVTRDRIGRIVHELKLLADEKVKQLVHEHEALPASGTRREGRMQSSGNQPIQATIGDRRGRQGQEGKRNESLQVSKHALVLHQIKNCLNNISLRTHNSLATLERINLSSKLQEDLNGRLSAVLEEVERAEGLTRQLALLREGAVRSELFLPLDLSDLVQTTIGELKSFFSEKRVDCLFKIKSPISPNHFSPDDWTVLGSTEGLSEAVKHLLCNAAEASVDGTQISVELVRLERHLILSIVDCGSGIRPELESKIFEPNFTTKPKGLGLGLTIAQDVVRQHGGYLEVRNRSDMSGAIAVVKMPVH